MQGFAVAFDEQDSSPLPLDIMAIYAIYQTVD